MISGDHFYAYAGAVTLGHRFDCFGAWRVDQPDETDEDQPFLHVGKFEEGMFRGNRLDRKREYALSLRRDALCLAVPIVQVDGLGSVSDRALFAAIRQHLLRGSLEGYERMVLTVVIECRHEAVSGVEGYRVGACPVGELLSHVDTDLAR